MDVQRITKYMISTTLLLGLICGVITFCGDNQENSLKKPVKLNRTISNAMSDSLGLDKMDSAIQSYMRKWNLRGASLAIMRNDSLLYARGYGWADAEKKEEMAPGHLFRLASVSKLLTATGIMLLCEEGKLSLDDKVFGPEGILNDSSYVSVIKDKNYYKITVEHLLRHQGGFTRAGGDPMFSTRYIMIQNKLTTPPDKNTLLRTQLKRRLQFVPGTSQSYSNIGYLLLSMIIEEKGGQDYEEFMRDRVFKPSCCYDFYIAGNYYKDRHNNEVKYYNGADSGEVQEYNNSGKMVDRCYGGNDVRSLLGAGAWVSSAVELARFVASIDGKPEVSDIISPESVAAMTEWIDADTYSLGWNDTKESGEWTRTGSFSGTSALIKYYPDGECWIMLTNTSTWKGPGFTRYTAELFSGLRTRYSDKLPVRDMFHR